MLEHIKTQLQLICKDQGPPVQNYAETKYLLIGGTGFLGKHLCEAINRKNCSATTISRNPDKDFIKNYAPTVHFVSTHDLKPDLLEHHIQTATHVIFAACSGDPISMSGSEDKLYCASQLLTRVTNLILKADTPPHLIYISSGGQIYGMVSARPIDENMRANPFTAYGREKLACEMLLNRLIDFQGLNATILRLANPVGKCQFDGKRGLVSQAVKAAHYDETLNIFGLGQNVRDYFDADEFSDFLLSSIDEGNLKSGIYNIGSGIGHTEKDIIQMVQDVTGHPIRTTTCDKRTFDLPYAVLDYDKAKRNLGWKPEVTISSMISNLSESITHNFNNI